MAIYMKFGSIDGDVTTAGYEKWIELQSALFGVSRHTTTGAGDKAREGAHPEISELKITKHFDSASSKLLQNSLAGKFDNDVTIDMTATTKNKLETYLEIELEKCGITSYQHSASPGQVPVESLTLNFTKITFSPSPLNVQGVPMRGGIVTFDLNTQVGGGGTR